MWIFSREGFISLVEDAHDEGVLQVRARVADDIRAIFPQAGLVVTPGGDYRYRARVDVPK